MKEKIQDNKAKIMQYIVGTAVEVHLTAAR